MGRFRAIIEPRILQGLRYHYTISDHLGSPRVIFSDDDNILSTTELLHESTSAVGGLTILNSYHYDHAGRKTADFIKINDLTEQQICEETYTAKEQIESLTLGNNLQVINYAYKGNGFLESINNPWQLGGDLWAMDLGYDAGTTAQTPNSELRKDGNITSVHWKTAGQSKQGYNYTYDYRSWLTNADYFESGKNGRYSTSYIYKDKRGNFNKIMRMGMMDGTAGQIDNLNFGYYPLTNQIRTITDAGTAAVKSSGYKSNVGDYTYNDNGAMDHDPSRGANFTLNYMDLPDEISVPDSSGSIRYLYDASGVYHGQLEIRDGKQVASRYHIGSVEYDDGIVDQIMTSQGYVELEYAVPTHVFRTGVEPNTTQQGISVKSEASVINNRNVIYEGGQYVCLDEAFTVDVGGDFEAWIKDFPPTSFSHRYIIKDHLGSARIIFSDLDKNGLVDASEIINHFEYYPFGSFWEGDWNDNSKYNHLFTGQERQKRFGLGYDRFGFRFYDPAIARFTGVDPISDQFPHVSTYNYAENSPIANIDLHGLQKFEHNMARRLNQHKTPSKRAASDWVGPAVGYGLLGLAAAGGGAAAVTQYGVRGVAGIVANELRDEGLSRATGGVSDYIDITRGVTNLIKNVNKIGGSINCEGCAIATDATLKGNPASALGDEFADISGVNSRLKDEFGAASIHGNFSGVSDAIAELGEGATGIVTVAGSSKSAGHAFNISNVNGQVRVFDGQLGTEITQDQLKSYLQSANSNGFSYSLFNTTGN